MWHQHEWAGPKVSQQNIAKHWERTLTVREERWLEGCFVVCGDPDYDKGAETLLGTDPLLLYIINTHYIQAPLSVDQSFWYQHPHSVGGVLESFIHLLIVKNSGRKQTMFVTNLFRQLDYNIHQPFMLFWFQNWVSDFYKNFQTVIDCQSVCRVHLQRFAGVSLPQQWRPGEEEAFSLLMW